jgi:hypothetical protein
MIIRIALIMALATGAASPTAAWAQNSCFYSLPQPIHARVVYLDRGRPGGFLTCRLTPRYRWLCDGWAGPGYVFYDNVSTCY